MACLIYAMDDSFDSYRHFYVDLTFLGVGVTTNDGIVKHYSRIWDAQTILVWEVHVSSLGQDQVFLKWEDDGNSIERN